MQKTNKQLSKQIQIHWSLWNITSKRLFGSKKLKKWGMSQDFCTNCVIWLKNKPTSHLCGFVEEAAASSLLEESKVFICAAAGELPGQVVAKKTQKWIYCNYICLTKFKLEIKRVVYLGCKGTCIHFNNYELMMNAAVAGALQHQEMKGVYGKQLYHISDALKRTVESL